MLAGGDRTRRLLDLLLIAEFTFISFAYYVPSALRAFGIDSAVYWYAARRWIQGGDPYANVGGLLFAAPPPTLLVVAPFSFLPPDVFAVLMFGASLGAAVFLLRRLRLPAWYLLFPPLVEALIVGNPNVIVCALLVWAVPAGEVVATFLKVYAAVPLLLHARWRSLVVIGMLGAASAIILPWGTYIGHAVAILNELHEQSAGGHSALAFPVLVPFAVIGLAVIGRKRGGWLAVPALWPATQFHYAVLGMPAMNRLVAALLAVPIPGAPAVAVIAEALRLRMTARGSR